MDTSKATPRPWTATDGSERAQPPGHVWGANGRLIAGCMGYSTNTEPDCGTGENVANAILIVRAVNAHAEMLNLLRRWHRCYPAIISPWPGISEETEALLAQIDKEDVE